MSFPLSSCSWSVPGNMEGSSLVGELCLRSPGLAAEMLLRPAKGVSIATRRAWSPRVMSVGTVTSPPPLRHHLGSGHLVPVNNRLPRVAAGQSLAALVSAIFRPETTRSDPGSHVWQMKAWILVGP